MSDPKWTPGPWQVGFEDGSGPEYILGGMDHKGQAVAKVRWGCGCCEDKSPLTDEEVANANLIGGATELYYALAEMVEWQEETDAYPTSDEHPLYKACAALAKARGESDE